MTAIGLTDDFAKVLVTAKIEKHAKPLLVEDARFRVAQPSVTLSGISGIGTLLAGNYIGFEPGKSRKERRRFEGLETPPIIAGGLPGREFVLRADSLGSVGIGRLYLVTVVALVVSAFRKRRQPRLPAIVGPVGPASGPAARGAPEDRACPKRVATGKFMSPFPPGP